MESGNSLPHIYLAPLQGFTDYIFRKTHHSLFASVDKYYIPYISLEGDGTIRKSRIKEVMPENNNLKTCVPQILAADGEELLKLTSLVDISGYDEININLGCPYPMVVNRGRGAALLPSPRRVGELLETAFQKFSCRISVKMRLGHFLANEIEQLIPVLNKFPLSEVIIHPRTARQLYKGNTYISVYTKIYRLFNVPVIYNGDIVSCQGYQQLLQQVPDQQRIMIGRGLLMNPLLADELKGVSFSDDERLVRLKEFHDQIAVSQQQQLSGDAHFLQKMRSFWEYFCYSFDTPHKVYKKIKKVKNSEAYYDVTASLFKK